MQPCWATVMTILHCHGPPSQIFTLSGVSAALCQVLAVNKICRSAFFCYLHGKHHDDILALTIGTPPICGAVALIVLIPRG